MRILIVSKVPTHPVTEGNRAFIHNNVELLKTMGHDIYFLYIRQFSIHKQSEKSANIEQLRNYWQDKLFIYHQYILQKIWIMLLQRYRWYFCRGVFKCDDEYPFRLHHYINKLNVKYHFEACIVNYYDLSKALPLINIPLKGLYTHDYFAYKSLLIGNKYVAGNTTAHEEAKAMQRTPHIFALNTGEAEYFRRLSPNSKVYNVFNYYSYTPQPIIGNHNLMFLSGGNPYNINGLMWFINEVFPLIVKRTPDVKLVIGGSICSRINHLSSNEHIQIVGFVGDINEFYSLGDVAINPTYQGTGLKIKTFEAVSYDKVTLAHPHSVDGIYEPEKAPLFSSNIPKEWVDYLAELWSDESKIKEIKSKNFAYIKGMQNFIQNQYQSFFDAK